MPNWLSMTNTADKQRVKGWVDRAPPGTLIAFSQPGTRSIDQNALMWKWLHTISLKTDWHGEKLSTDDWKDLFSAALKQARVVPGLEGGVVVLGLRTSKLKNSEFSELIELIQAFAAQRGITLECEEQDNERKA